MPYEQYLGAYDVDRYETHNVDVIEGPIPFGPGFRLDGDQFSNVFLYNAIGPAFGFWRAKDQADLMPPRFKNIQERREAPAARIDLPITAPSQPENISLVRLELEAATTWARDNAEAGDVIIGEVTRQRTENVASYQDTPQTEATESLSHQKRGLRAKVGRAAGAIMASLTFWR